MNEVRLNVVEDALVVRDHEGAHVGADEIGNPARDDLERVDVETRVGLVEHGDAWLQHRHLQDLDTLLLASREAVVQVPRRELAAHLQAVHLAEQLLAELRHGNRIVDAARARLARRIQRLAEEVRHRHTGNRLGVLEGQEEPRLSALVGGGFGDIGPVEQDLPRRDLVGRVAGDRVREGRLPRPVRAHHRVHLTGRDGQIDAFDDLGAVLEGDVQVFQLQLGHRIPRTIVAGWGW